MRKVDFVIIVILFNCNIVGPGLVSGQKNGGGSSAGVEIFTQEVYRGMSNYTSVFKATIQKELGFCIVDV